MTCNMRAKNVVSNMGRGWGRDWALASTEDLTPAEITVVSGFAHRMLKCCVQLLFLYM